MTEISNERIIKVEEREKSNTHRLDRLENLTEAIHRQNENIVRLVEKLEATNTTIKAHEKRLCEIEKLPRARQNAAFSAVVTAIASAVIGALVTFLFSSI